MKKCFYVLAMLWIALTCVFTVSCKKHITYEEMKAAENKIIKRIIYDNNIEVLEEYPKNGVFGENQFVQLNSGVYLNVVDSGNGNRPVVNGTDILVRASGTYYFSDTSFTFNTFANASPAMEFRYGLARYVVDEHQYYDDVYYRFFGTGIESVLAFVGDSAVVKLIVPGYAEISSYPAGSSMQNSGQSYFIPIFYDRVRFTFY
jgi:hypothetical protein